MQQKHSPIGNTEDHPSGTPTTDVTANFEQTSAQRAALRHAHWPPEFRSSNVLTNDASIQLSERLEPVPHGLIAISRAIEESGKPLLLHRYVRTERTL